MEDLTTAMRHREREEKKVSRRLKGSGEGSTINHFYVGYAKEGSRAAVIEEGSSPSNEPPSSQTDTGPSELVIALFDYCSEESAWKGYSAGLQALREHFINNEFDILSIRSCTITDWKDYGLAEGHRKRLQRSITKFEKERRKARSHRG